MNKYDAIQLLGGTVAKAAEAVHINPQAISQWPETLPRRLVDRVIAALVRTGREVPTELIDAESAPVRTQEAA